MEPAEAFLMQLRGKNAQRELRDGRSLDHVTGFPVLHVVDGVCPSCSQAQGEVLERRFEDVLQAPCLLVPRLPQADACGPTGLPCG